MVSLLDVPLGKGQGGSSALLVWLKGWSRPVCGMREEDGRRAVSWLSSSHMVSLLDVPLGKGQGGSSALLVWLKGWSRPVCGMREEDGRRAVSWLSSSHWSAN